MHGENLSDMNGIPALYHHLAVALVHGVGHLAHEHCPFGSGPAALNAGHNVGTLLQPAVIKVFREGLDDTQSQGAGSHVEEELRVITLDPVQLFFFDGFQVMPQAQDHAGILPGHIGSAAAVSGEVTQEQLAEYASQRDPNLARNETQDDPDQHTHAADIHGNLAPQVGPEGNLLDQPGGYGRQKTQGDAQKDLQDGDARHVHSHADAAEYMAGAADQAVEPPFQAQALARVLFGGNVGGNLAAELGVGGAGGIDDPAAAEEQLENLPLEGVSLVAHVHPLVQEYTAVLVQLDHDVAQPGPGHDHGGQVAAGHGQPAAQLTGGDALRHIDVADTVDGQGAHKDEPEQQSGACQDQHGNQLGVALTDVDVDAGEHIGGHRHGHDHGLMVIQDGLAGAGDHIVVDHEFQVGIDGILPVGGVEPGLCRNHAGHHHNERQVLHRQAEAAEQGQLHLQRPFFGNLDHIGNGKIKAERNFTDHSVGHPADVHFHGGVRLVGPHIGAVHGNVRSVDRQGVGKPVHVVIQPQGEGQGHLTVAVGVDGNVGVCPGGRAGGGCRQDQCAQEQHEYHRQTQEAFQMIPPLPKMA